MTRLRPEQLIGSILQSTSLRTIDQNSHLFVRAKRYFQENEFVKQYGDLGDNELDERSGTIAQALLRMNGKLASEALQAGPLSCDEPHRQFCRHRRNVSRDLLSRRAHPPADESRERLFRAAARLCGKSGQKDARGQVVEDIFWSLFNSPEFSWNH